MFLLNKEETYEYALFFKLTGDGAEGYLKNMFNPKSLRLYLGAKEFENEKLELIEEIKGRDAWKTFENLMNSDQYIKCNQFTIEYAK